MSGSREDGAIVSNGIQTASTIQCVHGGEHFEYKPGSGTKRGWCMLCNGMTCGVEKCQYHVPYEARIEYEEALSHGDQKQIERLKFLYPDIINIYNYDST